MEHEISITHTKTQKKKKTNSSCWWIFTIFLIVLIIAVAFGYWQIKTWFHDFAQSARQATTQTQN